MKVALRTFGCRANHYDTEAARALIEANGHTIVTAEADADVALFNSCAVTADAEADLRQAVRRAARRNGRIRSVIMGCASALPTRAGSASLTALPGVAALVAGADLDALADALALDRSLAPAAPSQDSARALLRIQDGCDAHCTFCATTLARGANRSRAIDTLVDEATALAARHREIVLTGIHIGTYGADIDTTLGALLERLVVALPGVRFRLSSVEASEVDERLRDLLRDGSGSVAPHLHAPLQSGSDRVLRRMGRSWYTAATYAGAVQSLVADRPVFGLGADIICGFPGESDDDHRQTVALVEGLPFTYLHVFPYSPRPGTAAPRLDGAVPPSLARERADELRAIGARRAAAYAHSREGGLADLVIIRSDATGRREGLTGDYLAVSLDGIDSPRGARCEARLTRAGDALVARPTTP